MDKKEFYVQQLELEWRAVLRIFVLIVPISITSALAWWVFSVEDSAAVFRVFSGMAAGMCWYLLLRHLSASASAWETLNLKIWHWSADQDVSRALRLGVSNQSDDRAQVIQPERIVPVNGSNVVIRTMAGFDVRDLAYFVLRSFELGRFGTSERNWLAHKMPSGRVLEDIDEWRRMQEVFGAVGLLVDIGIERKCSKWIVQDARVVLDTMRLPVAPPAPLQMVESSAVM